jgi:hypothetical protein
MKKDVYWAFNISFCREDKNKDCTNSTHSTAYTTITTDITFIRKRYISIVKKLCKTIGKKTRRDMEAQH